MKKTPPIAPQTVFSDIYPLDESYAARGETPPVIERIEAVEYRWSHTLLVHKTGHDFDAGEVLWGSAAHRGFDSSNVRENEYGREVALVLDR